MFYEQSGGTAVLGVNFEAFAGSVTIPEAEEFAEFHIAPLWNMSVTDDTTIVLSVLQVNCLGGASATSDH